MHAFVETQKAKIERKQSVDALETRIVKFIDCFEERKRKMKTEAKTGHWWHQKFAPKLELIKRTF